jgi:hypothetical protein
MVVQDPIHLPLLTVAGAVMDAIACSKPPIALVEDVDKLVSDLVEVAKAQSQHKCIQEKVLGMLAAGPVTYMTSAARLTVGAVLTAWAAFPGNPTLLSLGLAALGRGRRRQEDYLPIERFPDMDCTVAQLLEVIRLCPVSRLGQLLVGMSFCPATVLAAPGLVETVLRFPEAAAMADPLALYVVLDKAARRQDLPKSLWPLTVAIRHAHVATADLGPILKLGYKWDDTTVAPTELAQWGEGLQCASARKWATKLVRKNRGGEGSMFPWPDT